MLSSPIQLAVDLACTIITAPVRATIRAIKTVKKTIVIAAVIFGAYHALTAHSLFGATLAVGGLLSPSSIVLVGGAWLIKTGVTDVVSGVALHSLAQLTTALTCMVGGAFSMASFIPFLAIPD